MDWKVQWRNPKVQQGIMEVVFPIAGYFFWDWSVLIIVVFYLLDWTASQIMYTRRLNKIKNQFNEKLNWVLPLSILISTLLIVGAVVVLYYYFSIRYAFVLKKDLNLELITFLKEELWYLFPVIIFSYHMMDKMLFYVPRRFTKYSVRPYFYQNIKSNSSALVLIIAGVLMHSFVELSDVLTVVLIVTIKLVFDSLIKKRLFNID